MSELSQTNQYKSPSEREREILESLNSNPESISLLYELALLYETDFLDYRKAIHSYREITRLDPSQVRSWYSLGIIYYLLCNDTKSKESFLKVIEIDPDFTPIAWLYLARMEQDAVRALEYIEKSLRLQMDLHEALEVRGDIFFRLKNNEKALDAYNAYLAIIPGDISVILKKAKVLLKSGLTQKAKELLQEHASISEKFPDYWNTLGEIYRIENNADEARKAFSLALELQENNSLALRNISEISMEAGKYEEALHTINRLMSRHPTDRLGMEIKGRLLMELQRPQEALEIFEQLLILDPHNQRALSGKAELHIRFTQYDQSLLTLEKLLAMYPDDVLGWFQKGLTLDQMKRFRESIEAYDKAIELNIEFGSAWNNRGYAFYSLGEYDEAVKSYSRTIDLKEDFAAAWYNRACSLVLLNKWDDASRDLRKAFDLKERYKLLARSDSDFDGIRENPEFQTMIGIK